MTADTKPSVADPRLWCLHAIGPDDVYPAPDFDTAQKWADWGNKRFAGDGNILRFVVAVWPWSADSHADGLTKSKADWALPTPEQPEQDRAVVEEAWSFDDQHVGKIGLGGRTLTTRAIRRPLNLTNSQWYEHARSIVAALTATSPAPQKDTSHG